MSRFEGKVLIVGLGEVGRPLFELIRETGKYETFGYDVDPSKIPEGQASLPREVDILHICYPFSRRDEFVRNTCEYIAQFSPRLTIINSTVAPGTTLEVYERSGGRVAHSPIRGVHKTMKKDLLFWTKYVAAFDRDVAEEAATHFRSVGMKVKVLNSPFETELAKLFETVYRALLIAWFQEMHRISRSFGADFTQITDFLEEIHKIRFDRPLFFPDVIGGHCLIPNTKILLNEYESPFLKAILRSNEIRKEEIKDSEVKEEVKKLKEKVKRLEFELSRYPFVRDYWTTSSDRGEVKSGR